MSNIDIYNSSAIIIERKESLLYRIFIISLLLIFTLLFLLSTLYKYDKNYKLKALIQNGNLNLTVNEKELKLLNDNNQVLVDELVYKVGISSISEAIYDSNYNAYYKVAVTIGNKKFVENNIVDLYVELGKTTLYKEIYKRIKEGIR